MIQVGVVGMGFMGVTHIKAYRQVNGVRLAAICDSVRLPLDGDFSKISGNLGGGETLRLDMTQIKAYRDFNEMLQNPDIQLVDICTPTSSHAPLATAALKAGKHVICEKPLARNSGIAHDIVQAASQAQTYLLPAMCIRFWPEWAYAKKLIDDSVFGKVLAARFRRVSEPPAWGRESYFQGQQSGGAFLDLHIHDTDFVQFCFGRPLSVCSHGCSRFSGAMDHVVTQYRVKSGAVVYAEGSWLMSSGHGFNMAYTVAFEKATLDYDLSRGAEALRLFEEGKPPQTIKCPGADGYVGELQHMVDSVLGGKPPSIVTPADGLSAVEICEAEEKSILTKQEVPLG
ncbi:MAG TPA: Gfo/Idh/MocA family oxidoreductase [Verrucomicrobiota bacterium]|nr:Gfo/Idh/MocA family oxidoreductase [Verrucomicrobiota bacterium]